MEAPVDSCSSTSVSKFSCVKSICFMFKMQSIEDSFNALLTDPILTAFISEKRYIARSADSIPLSKMDACKKI